MAMNMGGDDYVTKPFDLNVLNAKVQALLRRTYDFAENADYLEAGGVMLNLSDATAVFNGKKIDLTKNEYRILQILYIIKKYSLESIVKQAVRKYAPLFIRKKISLNLEPINATVITDEKWLCFVIEQIISNAIKYTSSGSISIHAEGNGSFTALIVSDTGIGIAAEDLPRVFDNGFTGCNGRRDKKATGIGMYLSKKILDRLGHKISIQSAAGVGTAVRIEFIDKKDILE